MKLATFLSALTLPFMAAARPAPGMGLFSGMHAKLVTGTVNIRRCPSVDTEVATTGSNDLNHKNEVSIVCKVSNGQAALGHPS